MRAQFDYVLVSRKEIENSAKKSIDHVPRVPKTVPEKLTRNLSILGYPHIPKVSYRDWTQFQKFEKPQ